MSSGCQVEHLTLCLVYLPFVLLAVIIMPSNCGLASFQSTPHQQTTTVETTFALLKKTSFQPLANLATSIPPVTSPTESPFKCDIARMRCAYRMGCGMALQSYMITCAELIANDSLTGCPVECQNSLIALTSTDEGEDLVECDCDGSAFCELSKQRLEVCRHEVRRATAEDSIVSCQTARAICMADLPCATALTYYYNRCQSLFNGGKCHPLCRNSLDILKRQEKAAKLKTCYCEGSEDFECQIIKESTERLCLKNKYESNEVDNEPTYSSGGISFTSHQSFFSLLFLQLSISWLCLPISLLLSLAWVTGARVGACGI